MVRFRLLRFDLLPSVATNALQPNRRARVCDAAFVVDTTFAFVLPLPTEPHQFKTILCHETLPVSTVQRTLFFIILYKYLRQKYNRKAATVRDGF